MIVKYSPGDLGQDDRNDGAHEAKRSFTQELETEDCTERALWFVGHRGVRATALHLAGSILDAAEYLVSSG